MRALVYDLEAARVIIGFVGVGFVVLCFCVCCGSVCFWVGFFSFCLSNLSVGNLPCYCLSFPYFFFVLVVPFVLFCFFVLLVGFRVVFACGRVVGFAWCCGCCCFACFLSRNRFIIAFMSFIVVVLMVVFISFRYPFPNELYLCIAMAGHLQIMCSTVSGSLSHKVHSSESTLVILCRWWLFSPCCVIMCVAVLIDFRNFMFASASFVILLNVCSSMSICWSLVVSCDVFGFVIICSVCFPPFAMNCFLVSFVIHSLAVCLNSLSGVSHSRYLPSVVPSFASVSALSFPGIPICAFTHAMMTLLSSPILFNASIALFVVFLFVFIELMASIAALLSLHIYILFCLLSLFL